jgi:hypothetical protein
MTVHELRIGAGLPSFSLRPAARPSPIATAAQALSSPAAVH